MASRLGMFLYPATTFRFSFSGCFSCFSAPSVSSFNRSSFSVVSGSPLSPTGVVEMLWGGDVERPAGDVERVLGGLTAIESAFDTVVDASEVCDPVRNNAAASRGRVPDDEVVLGTLRLMRAASWFNEGILAPVDGLSCFVGSGAASFAGVAMVDVVNVVDCERWSVTAIKGVYLASRSTLVQGSRFHFLFIPVIYARTDGHPLSAIPPGCWSLIQAWGIVYSACPGSMY